MRKSGAVPIPVLTVGDANNSTYSGAITGALEIDKVGAGTLTLDGALNFDTLTATEGRVILTSATLNSLDIADGAYVELSAPPAPAAGLLADAASQAVPEPGSAALLVGGMLALLGVRRRQKGGGLGD